MCRARRSSVQPIHAALQLGQEVGGRGATRAAGCSARSSVASRRYARVRSGRMPQRASLTLPPFCSFTPWVGGKPLYCCTLFVTACACVYCQIVALAAVNPLVLHKT